MGIHHRQAQALETIAGEMRQIRRLFQKMVGEIPDGNDNLKTCSVCGEKFNSDEVAAHRLTKQAECVLLGKHSEDIKKTA